jgi:hypothetical protein
MVARSVALQGLHRFKLYCLNEIIVVVFFGLKEGNRDLEPMQS